MRAIYIAVVEVGCFAFLGSVSEIQMKLDALLSILLVITGLGVPCS